MAEVLGAVASAVQLADVALRSSRQVYNVLSSMKNAGEDIEALRSTLQDVDSNMRILRVYVIEFERSKNAIEKFEVLPDTITGCFRKFFDDITALKQMLPHALKPGFAAKAKWVFDKNKMKEVLARLNDRKTSLNTALVVMGLKDNLDLRQKSAEVAQNQSLSYAMIMDQFTTLNASLRTRERIDDRLFEIQRMANDKRSQQQDAAIDKISERCHSIQAKLSQNLNASLKSSVTIQSSLEMVYSSSVPRLESATAALRAQLLSDFRTMLGHISIKSETQFDLVWGCLEKVAEQISRDYDQHPPEKHHDHRIRAESHKSRSCLDQNLVLNCHNERAIDSEINGYGSKLPPSGRRPLCNSQCTWPTYHHFWAGKGRLGYLQIEIEAAGGPTQGSYRGSTTLTISLHFRPRQNLIPLRGLSLFWTTAPDHQGFYQICPSIATFPVIPDDHGALLCIRDGDLPRFRRLLVAGEIHLRSQDLLGRTLLHSIAKQEQFAAAYGRLDICKFLNSCGLSWDQQNQ
ncbi:uncharacterized protein K460DRAFT_428656 [Cucurbitaria berberidis CBS 394.84]|uniref:Fungal N-terminal domain-containing protein n=1 Tax=Cucurbitaria berberidis CBS 394.84 TaxID=1168544 RepID=A0A9P4GP78_9PLEO|nr:uncharacterized protein K460DRAFT_428656 [Cucurbitaria berberidis CBS 394.84]KAF1849195.1 hypothetical protein K460DRAFT_428656 [Cucurbitaria berberidis CBS 394.84]